MSDSNEDVVLQLVAQALEQDGNDGTTNGDAWLEQQLGEAVFTSTDQPPAFAPMSARDFGDFGKRIAKRLIRQALKLLCSDDPDDKADRDLLGITGNTAIKALTTALTSGLGVGARVASLVAALIFRRLGEPVYDELCVCWQDRFAESPKT